MKQDRTAPRFALVVSLGWAAACGGGGGSDPDAGPPPQDGAPVADASFGDAAVVDCTGDHRESADAMNDPFSDADGAPERTHLALTGGGRGFTVCGQIDPAEATAMVVDYDSFVFEVDGDEPVNIRIELVAAAGAGSLGLDLFRVEDGLPVPVATGPFRNGFALVAGIDLVPGSYWVSAVGWPPAPRSPIGYGITVTENRESCAAADGEPDFVETEAPGERTNDTVALDYPDPPHATDDDDAPEPTELVVAPGAVAHLRGTSGDVVSAGDSYLDRDAFAIATGPDVGELEIRVAWPDGDVDLDVYLFAAGEPGSDHSVGLGNSIGGQDDELFTINVDPDRQYWLWVGAFDGTAQGGATDLPVDYDVTLCPREHVAPAL